MKVVVELFFGAVAASVAYWLATPTEPSLAPTANPSSSQASAEKRDPVTAVGRSAEGTLPVNSTRSPDSVREGMSVADERALIVLRNELIRATSEDMHRRGQDVLRCLNDHRLSGTQKLRFSVPVDSTPSVARSGWWQLVEIVDGEPLPESFAECAAHAFGNGLTVAAASDQPFPTYQGELSMLYAIPAPRSETESR